MIREELSRYPVAAQTHAGMTGKNNEDRFAVSAFQLSQRNRTPVLLAVLCDGIGGHKAGEIAAELAVNNISQVAAESDGKYPLEALEKGIQQANQAIFKAANHDQSKTGMGSTTAIAWVIGNRLFTATVGDSRIYLMRDGHIRQLSIDHTWIQDALDSGLLAPDQVEGHPNRHVIRRYLGGPTPPEVDYRLRMADGESDQQSIDNQGKPLNPGDRLLLCSDGLTDLVRDHEILAAFGEVSDEQATQNLVDLANTRGGHDNITIVTFTLPNGIKPASKKRSPLPFGCAIAAIILGLMVLTASAYYLLNGLPWLDDNLRATPPIMATINPLITSAPKSSATVNPRFSLPTLTPLPLPTTVQGGERVYPSPGQDGSPVYPSP